MEPVHIDLDGLDVLVAVEIWEGHHDVRVYTRDDEGDETSVPLSPDKARALIAALQTAVDELEPPAPVKLRVGDLGPGDRFEYDQQDYIVANEYRSACVPFQEFPVLAWDGRDQTVAGFKADTLVTPLPIDFVVDGSPAPVRRLSQVARGGRERKARK